MSNSQFSFDGRRDGKSPEKSNFRQTCNILSQFMKGKGTLTDLNFGIPAKSEVPGKPDVSRVTETATMDFLTYMENLSTETKQEEQGKPLESVPQKAGTENCREMEVAINEPSTSKEVPKEPKLAQLTMFYDGKVMVFDDFPADRARAMMLLATKGNPHSSCGIFQTTTTTDKINTSPAPATTPSLTCSNTDKPKPDSVSAVMPQQQQQQVQSQAAEANNSSDLPIARRSSLHRFLAKRKDRAVARAPYQVHQPMPSSSKANEDQIDLNFKESSSKAHEDQIDLNFTL